MVYKVILSDRSIADLRGICEYIAGDDPRAALDFGHTLLDEIQKLEQLPRRGRLYSTAENSFTYEVFIRRYRIFYQINEAQRTVAVLHVRHTARQEPEF